MSFRFGKVGIRRVVPSDEMCTSPPPAELHYGLISHLNWRFVDKYLLMTMRLIMIPSLAKHVALIALGQRVIVVILQLCFRTRLGFLMMDLRQLFYKLVSNNDKNFEIST